MPLLEETSLLSLSSLPPLQSSRQQMPRLVHTSICKESIQNRKRRMTRSKILPIILEVNELAERVANKETIAYVSEKNIQNVNVGESDRDNNAVTVDLQRAIYNEQSCNDDSALFFANSQCLEGTKLQNMQWVNSYRKTNHTRGNDEISELIAVTYKLMNNEMQIITHYNNDDTLHLCELEKVEEKKEENVECAEQLEETDNLIEQQEYQEEEQYYQSELASINDNNCNFSNVEINRHTHVIINLDWNNFINKSKKLIEQQVEYIYDQRVNNTNQNKKITENTIMCVYASLCNSINIIKVRELENFDCMYQLSVASSVRRHSSNSISKDDVTKEEYTNEMNFYKEHEELFYNTMYKESSPIMSSELEEEMERAERVAEAKLLIDIAEMSCELYNTSEQEKSKTNIVSDNNNNNNNNNTHILQEMMSRWQYTKTTMMRSKEKRSYLEQYKTKQLNMSSCINKSVNTNQEGNCIGEDNNETSIVMQNMAEENKIIVDMCHENKNSNNLINYQYANIITTPYTVNLQTKLNEQVERCKVADDKCSLRFICKQVTPWLVTQPTHNASNSLCDYSTKENSYIITNTTTINNNSNKNMITSDIIADSKVDDMLHKNYERINETNSVGEKDNNFVNKCSRSSIATISEIAAAATTLCEQRYQEENTTNDYDGKNSEWVSNSIIEENTYENKNDLIANNYNVKTTLDKISSRKLVLTLQKEIYEKQNANEQDNTDKNNVNICTDNSIIDNSFEENDQLHEIKKTCEIMLSDYTKEEEEEDKGDSQLKQYTEQVLLSSSSTLSSSEIENYIFNNVKSSCYNCNVVNIELTVPKEDGINNVNDITSVTECNECQNIDLVQQECYDCNNGESNDEDIQTTCFEQRNAEMSNVCEVNNNITSHNSSIINVNIENNSNSNGNDNNNLQESITDKELEEIDWYYLYKPYYHFFYWCYHDNDHHDNDNYKETYTKECEPHQTQQDHSNKQNEKQICDYDNDNYEQSTFVDLHLMRYKDTFGKQSELEQADVLERSLEQLSKNSNTEEVNYSCNCNRTVYCTSQYNKEYKNEEKQYSECCKHCKCISHPLSSLSLVAEVAQVKVPPLDLSCLYIPNNEVLMEMYNTLSSSSSSEQSSQAYESTSPLSIILNKENQCCECSHDKFIDMRLTDTCHINKSTNVVEYSDNCTSCKRTSKDRSKTIIIDDADSNVESTMNTESQNTNRANEWATTVHCKASVNDILQLQRNNNNSNNTITKSFCNVLASQETKNQTAYANQECVQSKECVFRDESDALDDKQRHAKYTNTTHSSLRIELLLLCSHEQRIRRQITHNWYNERSSIRKHALSFLKT